MKAEDMGINSKGEHTRNMTKAETSIMGALSGHVGKNNKISADDLAVQWREHMDYLKVSYNEYQRMIEAWKRDVRYMVPHLEIYHGQPILSKAGCAGGYWIAESRAEYDEFYETFRRRAMTGFKRAARTKEGLTDMVKQLTFEFEELKTARPAFAPIKPIASEPAPVVMVSTFLDQMTREPEKYANELRLIRDKYGMVLLPREMFGEIQEVSHKLSGLLEKVA